MLTYETVLKSYFCLFYYLVQWTTPSMAGGGCDLRVLSLWMVLATAYVSASTTLTGNVSKDRCRASAWLPGATVKKSMMFLIMRCQAKTSKSV